MSKVQGALAPAALPELHLDPALGPARAAADDAEARAARVSPQVAALVALTGGARTPELAAAALEAAPEAHAEAYARRHFERTFAALAADPEAFHARMREVYGPGYDRAAAEAMRAQALDGDFSWLPDVEFVAPESLAGGHGAYDAASGTVYLSEDLLADPKLAAQTFMEEVGHHIDTMVNDADTAGDEGELFRRLMAGEALSAADKAEIRAEDDKGTIVVDGRTIEVEFWKPFKKIGKAFKKVGEAVKSVAKGAGEYLRGVGRATLKVFDGLRTGARGFFSNVFQGHWSEAFAALWDGLDTALFASTQEILDGLLRGSKTAFDGVTALLPDALRKPVRWVSDRAFDAGRSLLMGLSGAVRGVVNNLVEATGTFARGLGQILTGDFGDGVKTMGRGLLQGFVQTPVDMILLGLGKGVSAIQTLVGLEPPGRELTAEEIELLREIYGDAIDYEKVRIKEGFSGLFSTNDRPFVHGNTIYMKDRTIDPELLVHEMMHVWQYQNGGSDYMSEALASQWWGKGYDWESSVPDTDWADLEPEQQAEFMEAVYASGYFTDPMVTTFSHDGEDISDYVEDALEEIREGRGAP